MSPARLWTAGERCSVKCGEHATGGSIKMASGNGLSLLIELDEPLHVGPGVHLGFVALEWRDGDYHDLVTAARVTLDEAAP